MLNSSLGSIRTALAVLKTTCSGPRVALTSQQQQQQLVSSPSRIDIDIERCRDRGGHFIERVKTQVVAINLCNEKLERDVEEIAKKLWHLKAQVARDFQKLAEGEKIDKAELRAIMVKVESITSLLTRDLADALLGVKPIAEIKANVDKMLADLVSDLAAMRTNLAGVISLQASSQEKVSSKLEGAARIRHGEQRVAQEVRPEASQAINVLLRIKQSQPS